MDSNKQLLYNTTKLNPGTVWAMYIFLGWSYGSMDQMGKQILFYCTLGGFGVWMFLRFFTLSGAIKEYNRKQAAIAGMDNQEMATLGLL